MSLRPLNDTVIIELDPDEWVGSSKAAEVLKRGLIVAPDHNTMKKKSNTATIVSFGSKCRYSFKKGQKIVFRIPSIPVLIEGLEYRLIVEHQILGSLND